MNPDSYRGMYHNATFWAQDRSIQEANNNNKYLEKNKKKSMETILAKKGVMQAA